VSDFCFINTDQNPLIIRKLFYSKINDLKLIACEAAKIHSLFFVDLLSIGLNCILTNDGCDIMLMNFALNCR
jgi:hypothetical protein